MMPDSQPAALGGKTLDRSRPSLISGLISSKFILVWILVLAIVLRIASALYQGNQVVALPGIFDQISYDELARRVIGGHGFSFATGHWPATRAGEPTAHWSYLYTLYLAVVYRLFGEQPVIARLIQAMIAGVFHSWFTWRIGQRVFGQTIGIIAASLSAIYIYFFYYAGALITEPFYMIGILWTVDAALRLARYPEKVTTGEISNSPGWLRWAELGLAIGITALLRQVFLLFVPFLFLWLWWVMSTLQRTSPSRRGQLTRFFPWKVLAGLAWAACVVLILVIPWTIRNYRAFGALVPLNTNAGYAFFWGNHPVYGTHFVGLLPSGAQGYFDLIPKEFLSLNEAELDQALLKVGLGYVRDDPVRFILLSLSRAGELFKFWPSSQSGLISNISRVGSFGICLPFMLYGLWVSLKLVRFPERDEQREAIILLYLFILIYTGIHLVSWALIRYRLPVDAILLLFAALGLERLFRFFRLLPGR
jgi:hypothetical protein